MDLATTTDWVTSDGNTITARVGRAVITAWNDHDLERVVALHSADFHGTDVSVALPLLGHEGVRRFATTYLRAFPDLRFTIDELIADRDRTVVVWQARGTHAGPIMGIPLTRRMIEVRGVWIFAVEREQIVRATSVWDVAGLLRSLGLLPDRS